MIQGLARMIQTVRRVFSLFSGPFSVLRGIFSVLRGAFSHVVSATRAEVSSDHHSVDGQRRGTNLIFAAKANAYTGLHPAACILTTPAPLAVYLMLS